jgi:putative oxidoreductase
MGGDGAALAGNPGRTGRDERFLRSGGLMILNASLLVFLIAIGISWWRGIDIRCGCFGHSDATSNYRDLILRDLLLLAAGIVLVWHGKPKSKA